jgi:methylamine dehydrogenase heavy chain
MISAGQFATLDLSTKRGEIYVGETYHSRGSRGTRTDLITVYDMATLDVAAEIEIPTKRANSVVLEGSAALTTDERFFLVFNMNPATSVTVIDLDTRRVVGEIPTPGCSLTYPTAERGFFMLCGDGSLQNIVLDAAGASASQARSAPFIDIDADPLSEKSSRIGATWYFVSYAGRVQEIDASTPLARVGETWWLTSESERAEGWRPAGWHGTADHPDGRLFVAMMPNGYTGSHKDPATEVWVFDADKRTRTARIALETPAISIEVTVDAKPLLLVANTAGTVDVYDANAGRYLHTVQGVGETPYMIHRVE